MKKPFQSNVIMPDVSDRGKFGNLSFGYDRITEMRGEHSILIGLAANVCGVKPEDVTQDDVAAFKNQIAALKEKSYDELQDGMRAALVDLMETFESSSKDASDRKRRASAAATWVLAMGFKE